MNRKPFFVGVLLAILLVSNLSCTLEKSLTLQYDVSISDPTSQYCHVELHLEGWDEDTIQLKMPKWMPGYYQLMQYAKAVENVEANDTKGNKIELRKLNENTWELSGVRNQSVTIQYDVKADRQFVANSFIDSTHAYLVNSGIFMYIDGFLNTPVSVKVNASQWSTIATGLETVPDKVNEFYAPDFDILYDCPILIGDLETLPSFFIQGIEHRFIGYDPGNFDRELFMKNLEKVVIAASDIIGDIPYQQYTFIGIGKGRGGIEHLNNTTVSFNGRGLGTPEGMNSMMNFLAHEYFHHYNVKRIRPFELGPFDYDKGNNTNLLWVSEGLSVYYEYLVVNRAGLSDERMLLANFEQNINATENNPGRLHQSLAQASYATWQEGPFGTQGTEPGKSISYYQKGPIIGLLLDFEIRQATQNKKSLDDVMRFLYWEYYKKLDRGFTDAEFQQACEAIAGKKLSSFFEYIYTTKELDYNLYLNYAGLGLKLEPISVNGVNKVKASIQRLPEITAQQQAILSSWLGELN